MRSPETGKDIKVPLKEYLKSIPEMVGIRLNEEPSYEVVEADGAIEVRRYAPMMTATVPLEGTGREARSVGFRRLAAYLFGENSAGKALEMTAPVLIDEAERKMTVILPRNAMLSGPPSPVDSSIVLGCDAERYIATIRYSGEDDEETFREKARSLDQWLEGHKRYTPTGEPIAAEYDPPSSLSATKRNEVHMRLVSLH